ncbi:MAG: tetratricopeptide repeat protein [Deltaproteobacteria bacterium]|nr:tetratricopeptide repeat protein [Deltaproteobacteria bacterium]
MIMKHALLIFCSWWFNLAAAHASADPEFGIRLFNDKQWTSAQQFFESFTAKHPTDAIGAFYLGRTLFEQQQYEGAVEWLEKATLIDSVNSQYHLWLGRAYGYSAQRASILWQFPLARKVKIHFEKAIELDPDNIDARADLTEYYLKAPRILGGGKEKAEAQAHEISRRNLQEGLRAWRMIAAESAQEYVHAEQEQQPLEQETTAEKGVLP